jgi:hypothetical protein
MQAVAVNLEVLRSRSAEESGGSARWAVTDLARFAHNASNEFDVVARRIEALAYLCRGASQDADIVANMEAIAAVLASGSEQPLLVDAPVGSLPVAVSQAAARLALVHPVLAGVRTGSRVLSSLTHQVPVSVYITAEPASRIELDPDVVDVTREMHIHLETDESGITMTFPTVAEGDTVFV